MAKISIYQVFTRLFGNKNEQCVEYGGSKENGVGKFADFNDKALQAIKSLGVNYIWYTGIIEHARCEGNLEHGIQPGNPTIIKGRAGSPYAITDYYDVNPDLANDVDHRMLEFEALVKRSQKNGLKVIIDFVPNHVAREYYSDQFPDKNFGINDDKLKRFSPNNDFYYIPDQALVMPEGTGTVLPIDAIKSYVEFPAKATGNDNFSAYPSKNDWYETVKLNYGVDYENGHSHFDPMPPLWDKMLDILLFWASKGIDGFRCDMVEMVPVVFWEYAISKVKLNYPNVIFIAEVYNPALYHDYIHKGGFDYLYDKVGLYDTLKGIICYNSPASTITNCWQALNGLDSKMLRFLENHDEQRFASRFFTNGIETTIPALIISTFLNTGPIMTYFGQEVGEPAEGKSGYSGDDGRTTIFDYYNVPTFQQWVNKGSFDGGLLNDEQRELHNNYKLILNFALQSKAIELGNFYDLMWANQFEGGPNAHHIYAFLRYTENERLLIMVNFSKEDRAQFLLKFSNDVLDLLNIDLTENIVFEPLLFEINSLMISGEGIVNTGAWFNLAPLQGKVYRL